MPGTTGFSTATLDYLSRTPIDRRRRLGQFFTPAPLRERLLSRIELPKRPRILDPACGTGEFLLTARERWKDASLEGWELDPELAGIARTLVPKTTIHCCDALRREVAPRYDAVIGNPPYFEFLADMDLQIKFADAISGRPNSYALFVKLGIELLVPDGVLAYVVPPSMNNGAFFKGLRETIVRSCAVESLEVLDAPDLFHDAQQSVMLLTLRKLRERGPRPAERHVFRRGPFVLFSEDPAPLVALFDGCTTLAELGYTVRTGQVVWNQARADLVERAAGRGATRLVWSHNIGRDGKLDFTPRNGKPAFVRNRTPLRGPAIVVNRVTGKVGGGMLRVAAVPKDVAFVAENHVNVVLPPAGTGEDEVRAVAASLRGTRAQEAARRLTGNTQISATELLHLVPVRR